MSTSETETEHVITLASLPIRDDPFIKSLLAKLPPQSSETFTDGQLVKCGDDSVFFLAP